MALRVIVITPKEFERRANQHARKTQSVEQSVDARKLVGVRYVFAVLRQQVFYARQGCRGYVELINPRGCWHHRSAYDFVSNRLGVRIHG